VVDGVGYGGAYSGDSYFADAARAEGIEIQIGNIDDRDVDVADISVYGDVIFGEVRVDDAPVAPVDMRFFVKGQDFLSVSPANTSMPTPNIRKLEGADTLLMIRSSVNSPSTGL
jgi:hypothetical protein